MKQRYLIWLDDVRPVPKGVKENFASSYKTIACKTCWEARINLIQIVALSPEAEIVVCFDHDLGQDETGYDLAKWIVANEIKLAAYEVHSMNPVGRQNIVQLLDHYGYRRVYGISTRV